MPKQESRNRAVEARTRGRRLVAMEITLEADGLIDRAAEHLAVSQGNCTRLQALEWLIREGAKKIRKKSVKSA